MASLEPDWRALAARSDNIFATWEWLSIWWDHFGRERSLRLHVCRAPDGTAVAILPLYLAARRGARVLRFLGHGASDQLGPICHPSDRERAARALGGVLHDRDDWDVWIGDEVPADVDWADATGARRLASQSSPVVALGTTSADWIARRSRNLRHEVAKKARRLARRGAVRFRSTTDGTDVESDLENLIRLHDERWRSSGGSRSFRGRVAFHRAFAATAARYGWLRFHFVELDGRPIAGLYNLRYDGVEYAYQAGRLPEHDEYSLGTLLHVHAIREALDDGLREYRFLRGAEAYKQRFADRDAPLEAVAATNSAVGRVALASVARITDYPRWARRSVPAAIAWGTGGTPRWGHP
jgi:CelD/BcsL family acetyltransferase involved in cellulose biosynthesis